MIAELGHFALWLALGCALALAVLPAWGAQRGDPAKMALASPLVHALALCVLAAFACLSAAFAGLDFSLRYVASHANHGLPLAYRLAGVWGGHEGSLLLWVTLLVLWTVALARVAAQRSDLPRELLARALAVMGALAAGFLAFLLLASNPFERQWPAPAEGRDLNPLLQDPGMVLHPPLLYMGYVGFAVAFAFAVAALAGGRLDAAAARFARPWTVTAWACLTAGIALGSGWAYYELGWGGWWFWDPVENASLMPWLAGTALVHSLAVSEKRGAFKGWTALLAIVCFSLSLLGTFLVRSGVLSSVHAFATDPKRGLFILAFLVAVVGPSLALYARRAPSLGLGARFSWLSRETSLLANNALLLAACGAVLLGTLYPLALDALGLGKISVGPPYFNAVFAPLMAPVILLMGVGPLLHWKSAVAWPLLRRLGGIAAFSVAAALWHGASSGALGAAALAGLMLAWWVVAATGADLAQRLAPRHGSGVLARARQVPHATWAMWLAHLGLGIAIFGITLVSALEQERSVELGVGDEATLAGYTLRLSDLELIEGPNYRAMRGELELRENGRVLTRLHPEKRLYQAQDSATTEAAIHATLWRDVFVALGEPLDDGRRWILRLHLKPYIGWLWFGCALMALGGSWAAADRRYRAAKARSEGSDAQPEWPAAAGGVMR